MEIVACTDGDEGGGALFCRDEDVRCRGMR